MMQWRLQPPNAWTSVSIAALAFLLSTYTLYLQRRDRRPRLKISLSRAIREKNRGHDESTGMISAGVDTPALICAIRNVGDKRVAFRSVFLAPLVGRDQPLPLFQNFYQGVEPDQMLELVEYLDDARAKRRARLLWLPRPARFIFTDHMGRRWRSRFVYV